MYIVSSHSVHYLSLYSKHYEKYSYVFVILIHYCKLLLLHILNNLHVNQVFKHIKLSPFSHSSSTLKIKKVSYDKNIISQQNELFPAEFICTKVIHYKNVSHLIGHGGILNCPGFLTVTNHDKTTCSHFSQ
jgi:hypothetical protein